MALLLARIRAGSPCHRRLPGDFPYHLAFRRWRTARSVKSRIRRLPRGDQYKLYLRAAPPPWPLATRSRRAGSTSSSSTISAPARACFLRPAAATKATASLCQVGDKPDFQPLIRSRCFARSRFRHRFALRSDTYFLLTSDSASTIPSLQLRGVRPKREPAAHPTRSPICFRAPVP